MREIMMVWHNYWKRKIHPNTVLGIFVFDTEWQIHAYHLFVSSRSPNVYHPSSPYAWQFLEASINHVSSLRILSSIDAATNEYHPLKSKNPPEIDYALSSCVLSEEKNQPYLILFGKDGNRTLKSVLNHFFQTLMYGFILDELLGYVLLVDTQFYELHELKVKSQTGNEPPVDKILPAAQGWFGVDAARQEVDALRSFAPDAPFVITALNQDRPNAMPIVELRAALGINKDVPIIPCETTHTTSVHQVLFELLERHEVFYGKNAHADLARELIQLYKTET
jgi:hypothetical protein